MCFCKMRKKKSTQAGTLQLISGASGKASEDAPVERRTAGDDTGAPPCVHAEQASTVG